MSVINNNLLLTAPAAASGYQVSRSLRFNAPDSAYLNRTFAANGNRTAWSFSFWAKRSLLDSTQFLLHAEVDGNNETVICFTSSNTLQFYNYAGGSFTGNKVTTGVFRDPSAWYHILVVWDTANATASDRMRIYINGVQVTTFSTSVDPPQNQQSAGINVGRQHRIGSRDNTVNYLFGGHLADVYFIDGQALGPSSFTTTDATTGQLIPKAFSGTYGTNGFHLEFADNSAATAAALGKDTSGNGNNWTPNNLSVTAGAGNDSLVDVPTNGSQTDTGVGGEVNGNYCTWNPLNIAGGALANGNLDATNTGGGRKAGTIAINFGKWYWEVAITSTGDAMVGVMLASNSVSGNFVGGAANEYGYYLSGNKYTNGTSTSYGATFANGDVIGVALNLDSGTLTFYKNGTSQGVAFSSITGTYTPAVSAGGAAGASMTLNAGARPFAYTAPSGFKALCTANLPTPTIVQSDTAMDVVLYTGTGSAQTPTSSLGFSPDLVWIKSRSNALSNKITDSVRGVNNALVTDTTAAETVDSGVTAFNSNGFTLGTGGNYNTSSATYVAWCWDAGSSSATNNAGSISSTVRANATAGFSIVTYTGTGSNATVGHGLGAVPGLIILKTRSIVGNWISWHLALSSTSFLYLNTTDSTQTATNVWNSTLPSSTVFSIGTSAGLNTNGATHVAYCFAPVVGYSSFGSYTGNGNTDGPFVFCNFAPAFVMIKRTDAATYSWAISDYQRPGYNQVQRQLFPNQAVAETNDTVRTIDLLSNGFKLRNANADTNASAGTYIYAAFALNPIAYARAR